MQDNKAALVHRFCFYAVLGLVAVAALALIPVKWNGWLEFPPLPFPSIEEVSLNLRIAFGGGSNGYTRAFRGYLTFAFMAGAFLSSGRFLLHLILREPKSEGGILGCLTGREKVSFYWMMGSLIYSLLWLGLGLSGHLNSSIGWIVGVAGWLPFLSGLVSGFRSRLDALARRLRSLKAEEAGFLLTIGTLLFFLSSNAAFNPIGADTLTSHAGLPNAYLQSGQVFVNPYHIYSYLSQKNEMLILWSLLLGSDFAAQLLVWGFLAAWLLLIWGFLERHAGSLAAMAAVALALSIPLFSRTADEFKNDASVGLFLFAHYVCLIEALREGPETKDAGRNWYLLSGIALGGAIGHKLVALPAAFFTLSFLAVDAWIKSRKNISSKPLLVPLIAGMLMVAWPWLLRAYIYTGNPVYPVFKKWFPTDESPNLRNSGMYFYDLLFGYNEIVHRNIADGAQRYDYQRPTWGPSLFFALLIIPCAFLPSARGFRLCWSAALLSYTALHLRTLLARYHLGLLVFLVVTLFAFSWREVLERSGGKFYRRLVLGVLALAMIASNVWICAQPSFSFLLSGYSPGNRPNMKNGMNELYWMAHVFNTRSAPGDSVLLAGIYGTYPFKRRVFANGALDPEMLGRLSMDARDADDLKERLSGLGVHHIIISKSFYHWIDNPAFPFRKGASKRLGAMLSRYMRVVYVLPDGSMTWYVFREDAGPDKIVWDARDAELFPGDFIGEAKALRASGNEAEARRLLEMALPVPMMAIHKDEVKRLLNETERK